jgi:hypothetical protein
LRILAALPASMLLLPGCMSGESETAGLAAGTADHRPFVKAASILPSPLVLSGPLSVRVEAQDLDHQTMDFRYRWLVNGRLVNGHTQNTLPAHLLKRGDQVAVEVIPFDGAVEGTPFRTLPVPVVNTAPIISDVSVDFDHDAQGRRLLAKVDVADPDLDPVSLAYRWRKNDTVVKEGEDNTLDLANVTAKDVVEVEVTASDGNGTTSLSGRYNMSNSSPTILSSPSVSATGSIYEYQVQASDPDGDPITYKLEEAPPGMIIGEQSGRIRWSVTPEAKGSYRIKVVAQDNKGGFAAQDFELSISAPAKAS